MAGTMNLGFREQCQRLAWADLEPEEDVLELEREDDHRGEPAHEGNSVIRSRRRRGARRKAKEEQQTQIQKQASLQLPQPELSASRSVNRSVVTWSDLLGPSDASPCVSSEVSTAASSPIPSPPLSARMPCYASASGGGQSTPFVIVPMAFTPGGGTSTPCRGFGPLPGSHPGVPIRHQAAVGQPTAVEAAQPWIRDHSSALQHALFPGCAGNNSARLEELLQQAAQAPYED
eukprot:TRINITY_DN92029_c0_g1_i1.p1 TRINITY_DN92029_c0_g1~~TRINITY_DN92029_c0_g1_i1.p1  ORF type:complete len:232 (+),score=49.95 TRINITY_DN92029_c0_g1_i1:70-765(+)